MSEKFIQPIDGIRVVKRSGVKTLLTEEILDIGRSRIASGEDLEEVARDLAIYEVSLIPPPEYQVRTAGGTGSGNFSHGGRPGERGGSSSEFYHGTSTEIAEKIKTQGLKPLSPDKKAYVTTNERTAASYAVSKALWSGQEEGTVAVVVLDKGASKYFDFDVSDILGPGAVSEYGDTSKRVPARFVREVRLYDLGELRTLTGSSEWLDSGSMPKALKTLEISGSIFLAMVLPSTLRSAGSLGSGNFGHSGRPGEKGGSGEAIDHTELSEEEKSLRWYGNPVRGRAVNSYLRGGALDAPGETQYDRLTEEDVKKKIASIDSSMKSGKEETLYRTYTMDEAPKAGESFTEKGYTSASRSKDNLNMFARSGRLGSSKAYNVRAEIVVPEDVKRADMERARESTHVKGEHPGWTHGLAPNEVVIARDTSFKVESVRKIGRSYRVRLVAQSLKSLGGVGSGNFGHSGRPGQIGGSSSEGSSDSVEKQYPRAREGKTILEDKEGLNTLEQYLGTNGKLTKERRELHDRIVADALKGKISVDEPHVYLMGGGPASGKSVLTAEINLPANHVLVDPDTVRTKFPEWKQELKAAEREGRTPHTLLAAYTHEEASMLTKRIGAEAARQKMHIVADGTGNSSLESITRKVEGYRANGHKVIANYVTVDTDEAVRRAEERGKVTGRFVPESYTRAVHASVSRLFPLAVQSGLFDEVTLWDNNSTKPVKVLSGRGKDVQIHEHELYQRFLSKARRS